ncbi:MAG: three-Cys-motif partner protein TcmP [Ekhidna sp.]|nr:three-Cys-motif partner protein TcmP [Ekhidna sp.]
MSVKDLHDKPFDEGTIAKLEIFEAYTQAWLPTFVMVKKPTICIFDFFAGTGYDKNGVGGSPIRILNKIKEQTDNIRQKNFRVKVFFNEYKKGKYGLLSKTCEQYLETNKDVRKATDIRYYNEDFTELFPKLLNEINDNPSLVFLDQNGIQFSSPECLSKLENTTTTDFLYFLSVSYLWRFGNQKGFKDHLAIDMDLVKQNPYKLIHRSIIEQLRKKLPASSQLKLYPYSIKKKSGIYGIIFGAKHPLAVDKFLNIAWKRNAINGEANYDLDDDVEKTQLLLFGNKKLTKLEKFESSFREKVLNGKIGDNRNALDFAYSQGHIAKHAADVLRSMKKEGLVSYDSNSPYVTYENVYKNKKSVSYSTN